MRRSWTEDLWDYQGEFIKIPPPGLDWKHPISAKLGAGVDNGVLKQVATVPKPRQLPYPPLFTTLSQSPETVNWSAKIGASVVTLAANPDIAKAVTQPDIDFWEGTYLLQNVLEAARVTGVRRMFYTSGSGVYGENAGVAFTESYGPCIPISTYGASKLACEALIAAYCHMFGLEARAFRFANVVGPRQTHPQDRAVDAHVEPGNVAGDGAGIVHRGAHSTRDAAESPTCVASGTWGRRSSRKAAARITPIIAA